MSKAQGHLIAQWSLICCAVALVFFGIRLTLSAAYSHQLGTFFTHWEQSPNNATAASIDIALNAAHSAQALFPSHSGRISSDLARLAEWRAHALNDSDDAEALRLYALDLHRDALQARPWDTDILLDLAATKITLQQFDDELETTFNRAYELGNNHQGTLLRLLGQLSRHWHSINNSSRFLAIKASERLDTFPSARLHLSELLTVSPATRYICSSLTLSNAIQSANCR